MDNAVILISEQVDQELLGVFANSFYLANYELTLKTDPSTRGEAPSDKTEEDYDNRKEKFTKKISNVIISTKDSPDVLLDPRYAFWIAAARSSEYTRDIANVRASIATPDFMEE